MDSATLREILAFEGALKPGDPVHALWTNSNNYYAAEAEVVRVNRASIRIRLVKPPAGYGVGQEFPVPRCAADRWSENNRVAPLAITSADSGALLEKYVEACGIFGYFSQEAVEAFERWSLATFDREVTDRASYTPRGDADERLSLGEIYPRPDAADKWPGKLYERYMQSVRYYGYASVFSAVAFKVWAELCGHPLTEESRVGYTSRPFGDKRPLPEIYPGTDEVKRCEYCGNAVDGVHTNVADGFCAGGENCPDFPDEDENAPTPSESGVHTLWLRLDIKGDIADACYVLNELLDQGIPQAFIDDHELDAGSLGVADAAVVDIGDKLRQLYAAVDDYLNTDGDADPGPLMEARNRARELVESLRDGEPVQTCGKCGETFTGEDCPSASCEGR